MKPRTYIVTGGAGFIGSHVVDLLVSEGHAVKILDNLSTGSRDNVNPQAELVECDLARRQSWADHFRGAAGVFHLAALPRIQPSFADPVGHDDANVRATLNVLLAMRDAGVRSIVFSSSSAVYGNPEHVPTSEDAAIRPLSPYSLQKYSAEQYVMILSADWGIKANALRYFNVYGPRSFNPSNPFNAYSSVVGIFKHRTANGLPIAVTGDGTQERDFVHAFDVATANYLAQQTELGNQVLNVGTGVRYSINAVARLFADTWTYVPARPGEANVTHARIDRIARVLGWNPTVSLEHAVARGSV